MSPNYRVERSGASALTNLKWETVATGKEKTRLKLGDDPRFHVAVKQINENSNFLDRIFASLAKRIGLYAEIRGKSNETLFVNINSVAKRLFLTKTQIQEAANENKLLHLLESEVTSGITYQNIVKQQEPGQANQLIRKDSKNPTELTPELLMKVIREAEKIVKEAANDHKEPKNVKKNSVRHFVEVKLNEKEKIQFAAKLNKKGGMKLTQIGKNLGSGAFGEAFVHIHLNQGIEEVYKQAKTGVLGAIKDVKNEHDLLKQIHSKGTVWGIQAKPSKLLVILKKGGHKKGGETIYGFLGKKYDGDYSKDIQEKPKESLRHRLFEFHQLLYGLKHLAANNLLHGDLKPQNILVKKELDGTKSVHIADLGGAADASKWDAAALAKGIYTRPYYPKEDEQASQLFLKEARQKKTN